MADDFNDGRLSIRVPKYTPIGEIGVLMATPILVSLVSFLRRFLRLFQI